MTKKKNFQRGQSIHIPNKVPYTIKAYTINASMKLLLGTSQKIDNILPSGDISIRGWSWDRKDFITHRIKKIAIQHFDPEELVT